MINSALRWKWERKHHRAINIRDRLLPLRSYNGYSRDVGRSMPRSTLQSRYDRSRSKTRGGNGDWQRTPADAGDPAAHGIKWNRTPLMNRPGKRRDPLMNRRKFVVALAAVAALSLTACSNSGSTGETATSTPSTTGASSDTGSTSAPGTSSGAGDSGSSSTPASSGNSGAPQTLVVQTSSYYEPLMKAVGTELEKQNPGLKVTYQQVSADQETSTNLQVLTSSNAPDIGDAPINGNVYPELLKAGQLTPLNDVWTAADLENAYGSSVANSLKSNGTPYVVDFSNVYYGFAWYDKDIFAKLNIPDPADHSIPTMDDLKKITDALRAGGYQPLLIPGGGEEYWNWMTDAFLPTSATPAQFENYATNFNPNVPITVDYADQPFAATFDRLKQMYDDKMFQDGVLGMNNASTQALYASGKADMIMGHALTPNALDTLAKKTLNLDWTLLPPINSGAKSLPIVYNGNTLVIPKKASNPEMAKKFLILLMSPEIQKQIPTIIDGAMPAIAVSEGVKDPYGLLKYVADNGDYVGWAAVTPGQLNQIDSKVQAVLVGQKTSQEVGKEIDAVRDKLRAGS